jgi:zinc protease
MIFKVLRDLRVLSLSVLGFGLVAAAPVPPAKPAAAPPKAVTPSVDSTPWLYRGSDIPVDKSWTFGVLPNAVRYAVRRGSVPPGQVSIRVAIDAGSLMESETERGFAHYIEHLSFRGSRHVKDGEAKRVWQRLGATFGSDSNAATTPTQTIFKLDLPNAKSAGLDESLKILAGMMAAPSITDEAVNAERRTVLAETREQFGPQIRARDASSALFFHGQLLATRSPIGTPAALNAATATTVKAFHTRWYRPERLIVSISGDGDPAEFEALVKKHFSGWTVPGIASPDPDFGRPDPKGPTAMVLTEPGLPSMVSLATLRPWVQKNDTIAYNQGKLLDLVAIRLINRRLETRARAGGSFLQAQVDREDVARSADGTFVSIIPIGNDWRAALKDVRAVIADATTNPPTQSDIDREVGEFVAALDIEVESARAEASAKQADDIIEAVNIRETVATPDVARDVFGGLRGKIGPKDILASTKSLFVGVGARALLSTQTALPKGDQELAAALAEPVVALASASNQKQVTFAQLPKLPKPGKVVNRTAMPDIYTEVLTLSNGVKVVLYPNRGEAGRVYVTARFGKGMQAIPSDRHTPAWAAPAALVAGGIGDFGQEEIDRLTSGRRINLAFETGEDAFFLRAVTRPADLKDQLTFMATKLYRPRWDAAPVLRARAGALLGLDTADAAPQSVLSRELGALLHGGDRRWASPNRAEVAALTPQSFRAFWEPLLQKGPIELSIFGDFDPATAISAAESSFGALAKRPMAVALKNGNGSRGPVPNAQPLKMTHAGPVDQAAAVLAWELGGGIDGIYESRKLDVLAAVFSDRLFERFREAEGGSYSPSVSSNWPTGMERGGNFFVAAQLKPETIDRFFALSKELAIDLAKAPVGADELARAIGPMREQIARASSGNSFWMSQLSGATEDPRRIAALQSLQPDLARITPAELQAMAARYLVPDKAFSMVVVPGPKPQSAAAPAATPKL